MIEHHHHSNVLLKSSLITRVSTTRKNKIHRRFGYFLAPKIVRFESKWIASLSLLVKLSLAFGCIYLMCQRTSYQIFDRSPISAVTITVKPSYFCSRNASIMHHFPDYNCTQSIYDVNDFILPAIENSAVSITTRMAEIEHVLTTCENSTHGNQTRNYPSINSTVLHSCHALPRCIVPPFYRGEYENQTIYENQTLYGNQTITRRLQLCWYQSSTWTEKTNYQALDYLLFVRNYVDFPLLGVVRDNFAPHILLKNNAKTCEYDKDHFPLCPRFRILKILEMVEKDTNQYRSMFQHGSLIEIKISWNCDLDRHINNCKPQYAFQRLDIKPYEDNPFDPGSHFMTSKHFFRPNDQQLHRLHTKIYNLHIIVSVTGEVGKFDLFQTTTSIGSFIGIFGTGTIVCDLIAAFFTNFRTVKYGR